MLVNFSNHHSSEWSEFQRRTAMDTYDTIFDIAFPIVSSKITEDQITELAHDYLEQILALNPTAVHIMGELNFTHKFVSMLKSYGVKCVASTTERNSVIKDNIKTSHFKFIQFREY
jgi:hypothetical protein